MATALDQAAGVGARHRRRSVATVGLFRFREWGANWAGGVGSPLEAVYYWMYDDGPGSSTPTAHRVTAAAVGDTGTDPHVAVLRTLCHGRRLQCPGLGRPTELGRAPRGMSSTPAADFTWQQEAPYL